MDAVEKSRLSHGADQNDPELFWLYEYHLKPLKPRNIIEIGVGKTDITDMLLKLVGKNGKVIGVSETKPTLSAKILANKKFRLIQGSPSDPRTLKKIRALVKTVDILFLNGDHSPYNVIRESECCLPLLRPGGLAVWQNICFEDPEGIRQTWYGVLKPRFLGATEYFVDPFQGGMGLWYQTEDNAAALLERAEVHLEASEDRQAEVLLRRLVAHRRGHGHAWFDLAMALWDHNLDEAREALAMAVAARPNLYPHALDWAREVGEEAPLPIGETGSSAKRLRAVEELTRMRLYRRGLEVLETIMSSDSESPLALVLRVDLLEKCRAPAREISRALLDALDAQPAQAVDVTRTLLEKEGARVTQMLLKLRKYPDAVRFTDALVHRFPSFRQQASTFLANSMHFCIWASKHGLTGRINFLESNFFRNLLRELQEQGHQRVGFLPASTITLQLLENQPEAWKAQLTLYDNYKAGQSLAQRPILSPLSLTAADCDIVLITSLTYGRELTRQLLDNHFPPEKIRDITRERSTHGPLLPD